MAKTASGEWEPLQALVAHEYEGATLAAAVRAFYPGMSWNIAKDLCRTGRVRVDEAAETDPTRRVRAGTRVSVMPTAPKRRADQLSATDVFHLDGEVLVVRKPAGISTVPFAAGDQDTLLHRAQAFLRKTTSRGKGGLRVVQRLDKGTSGVLVFARTHRAETELQAQFRRHSVLRTYDALAHGRVEDTTYDSHLLPDRGDGLRGSWRAHDTQTPPRGAKHAVTHVQVRERLSGATRLLCRLETGRQHQIRIHLAENGHPLVGESVYIRDYRGCLIEAARPMLHAAVLAFEHPATGTVCRFEDPPPSDYVEAVERLRESAT